MVVQNDQRQAGVYVHFDNHAPLSLSLEDPLLPQRTWMWQPGRIFFFKFKPQTIRFKGIYPFFDAIFYSFPFLPFKFIPVHLHLRV